MLETLLDKGMVINADIAITVGDTELLGIQLRAAIASFETAERYGLEFPAGTGVDSDPDSAVGTDDTTAHGTTAPVPRVPETTFDDG
jgi:hypothetical protein